MVECPLSPGCGGLACGSMLEASPLYHLCLVLMQQGTSEPRLQPLYVSVFKEEEQDALWQHTSLLHHHPGRWFVSLLGTTPSSPPGRALSGRRLDRWSAFDCEEGQEENPIMSGIKNIPRVIICHINIKICIGSPRNQSKTRCGSPCL